MFDDEKEIKARAFEQQTRDIGRTGIPAITRATGTPVQKFFNGRLFLLKHTCDNKNAANKEALKYHKHGYHTRVIETSPGVFSVYRRDQPTVVVKHGRKFTPPPPPA